MRTIVDSADAILAEPFLDYTAAYNELTLDFLRGQRDVKQIEQRYDELSDDPLVGAALANLNSSPDRLGPSRQFIRDCKQFDRLEDRLMSATVPAIWKGEHCSLSAILNEKIAVPFHYWPGDKFTLVPQSALEQAGVAIDPNAPLVEFISNNGNQFFVCHRIRPATIHIGRHMIKDSEVLVLSPPRPKVLGPALGADVLVGFDVQPQRSQFRVLLKRRAASN